MCRVSVESKSRTVGAGEVQDADSQMTASSSRAPV